MCAIVSNLDAASWDQAHDDRAASRSKMETFSTFFAGVVSFCLFAYAYGAMLFMTIVTQLIDLADYSFSRAPFNKMLRSQSTRSHST